MPYQGLRAAREVVRVRLKAVVFGVEECHPPREARGVAVQVILMGLLQVAVRDPRVGDGDVRAGRGLHAVARRDLRETRILRGVYFLIASQRSLSVVLDPELLLSSSSIDGVVG